MRYKTAKTFFTLLSFLLGYCLASIGLIIFEHISKLNRSLSISYFEKINQSENLIHIKKYQSNNVSQESNFKNILQILVVFDQRHHVDSYRSEIESWYKNVDVCGAEFVYIITGTSDIDTNQYMIDSEHDYESDEENDFIIKLKELNPTLLSIMKRLGSTIVRNFNFKWFLFVKNNVFFDCLAIEQHLKFVEDDSRKIRFLGKTKDPHSLLVRHDALNECTMFKCDFEQNVGKSQIFDDRINITKFHLNFPFNKDAMKLFLLSSSQNRLMKTIGNQDLNLQFSDIPESPRPTERLEVPEWSYFNATHGLNKKLGYQGEFVQHQDYFLRDLKSFLYKATGNMSIQQLSHGYTNFDPSRGLQFILHLNTPEQSVYNAIRPLYDLKLVNLASFNGLKDTVPLNVVVSISSNQTFSNVIEFINSIQQNLFQKKYSSNLIVEVKLYIMFNGTGENSKLVNHLKRYIKQLKAKPIKSHVKLSMKIVLQNNQSSFFETVKQTLPPSSLIIHAKLSAVITPEFIELCILHTTRGRQMYAPVPFQLYHSKKNLDLRKIKSSHVHHINFGRYNSGDWSVVSFFLSDWMDTRSKSRKRLDEVCNDVIIECFSDHSQLEIFRALDPYLILKSMNASCDESGVELDSRQCAELYGSQKEMAQMVLQKWKMELKL